MVSRPNKDGISCVAGKRSAWALLIFRRGPCLSPWCSRALLSVRNVSLDALDHSHSWSQLLFQDLLACRFEGRFAVLFAQVGQHVASLKKSAGYGGTITIEDHRYDCVRCCPKRRGPSQEFVAGERLVAFVIATWSMVGISGIPVFKSVKTCVLRVSDCLCVGAWFTSSPRIGRGKPRLVG